MNQLLSIFIIALIKISCFPVEKIEYSINKGNINSYRQQPVKNSQLLKVIEENDEFINIKRNPAISSATLEHHLIRKYSINNVTIYFVFEYFFLEGVTCNIKAVTIDDKNNLLSILRLANYEEYPDGNLNEFAIIENDFVKRITIVNGVQEYLDSKNQFIMKRDSTFMTFKLNNYSKIEILDSVFKHSEYSN